MRIALTMLAAAVAAAALTAPLAFGGAAATQTVRVTESDYRISLSTKPRAGKVTFVIRNGGSHSHDFRLKGNGITRKTPLLAPGQTARLTVTLKRGERYQLWCAPHEDRGMRAAFVAR